MSPTIKKYLTFIGLILGVYIISLWFSNLNTDTSSILDKKTDSEPNYDRNKEFLLAIEKTAWLEDNIRKIINEHKNEITTKNCSGVLEDMDNDNVYEKFIFDKQIQHNSNVIFRYNFCSYTWNTSEQITIMATTNKMNSNFLEKGDYGEVFLPVYIYKKSIQKDKDNIENIVEDQIGLIKHEEFFGH